MLVATACALSAAVLHASWNFALKQGGDRYAAASLQFLLGGILFVPVIAIAGPPKGEALGWLAASTAVHLGYVTFLVRAYGTGDFSMAYPMARGSGALLAAIGGALLLSDGVSGGSAAGMAIAGLGLLLLVQPGGSRAAYGWALATGVLIATYTLIDARGSRASNGAGYAAAQSIAVGVLLTSVGFISGRGPVIAAAARRSWRRYALAGMAATTSYGLVLIAVRHAPVGYVAVLRETSVILGPLAGWLLLKEGLGKRRAVAAAVVVAGMAVLVAAR